MMTRKRFLLLGSFGVISTLIPKILFSKTLLTPNGNNNDTKVLLKKAKKYRKQKKYNLAKSTYEEVLTIDPAEVRAYNGIRKILLDKKNKEYEVILLYQQALTHLPNNFRIKHRLYNEYFKASLGNKKILQKLNISGRVLTYVKTKYEELLAGHPEKKNIQNQLDKINKYVTLNVDTGNPRNNKLLKAYRKEQKKNFKNRFNGLNSQQVSSKLSVLEAKPFSEDRKRHIREMQKVNVKALRKEKKYADALNLSSSILANNNLDPHFIKQFRDLAKQLKQYDKLLIFETKNHASKKTFWSATSLFDVHYKIAESQNLSAPSIMDSLVQFMTEKISDPQQQFELNTRKIKLELLKTNLSQAKDLIMNQCEKMKGSSSAHSIDRMNVIIAEYCKKAGDLDTKSSIVKIALDPKYFLENNDELKRSIAYLNIRRSYENPIHIQNLQKKLTGL